MALCEGALYVGASGSMSGEISEVFDEFNRSIWGLKQTDSAEIISFKFFLPAGNLASLIEPVSLINVLVVERTRIIPENSVQKSP